MVNIDDINKSEWENPENWTSPGFYFSKKDTRWVVPKRNQALGWTFNLGHMKGAWAMLLSFLIPTIILLGIVVFIVTKVGH
ncbi:MAG: hypothetical protein HQK96_09755 [Nitrospirae bacterium]|nr:hypothetical protein [Nitrospirota bacterium]